MFNSNRAPPAASEGCGTQTVADCPTASDGELDRYISDDCIRGLLEENVALPPRSEYAPTLWHIRFGRTGNLGATSDSESTLQFTGNLVPKTPVAPDAKLQLGIGKRVQGDDPFFNQPFGSIDLDRIDRRETVLDGVKIRFEGSGDVRSAYWIQSGVQYALEAEIVVPAGDAASPPPSTEIEAILAPIVQEFIEQVR